MNWGNATGTLKGDRVATLWCSGTAPCTGINLFNNTLWALDQNIPSFSYLCEAVESTENFNCTHKCNGDCPK